MHQLLGKGNIYACLKSADNLDQVAMLCGEKVELERIAGCLESIRSQMAGLAFAQFGVKMVSDIFSYMGGLGNFLLISVAIFFPGWWSHAIPGTICCALEGGFHSLP